MRLRAFAALRRVGCVVLTLASVALCGERTASAQALWHANPTNPVYVGIPRTLRDQGVPSKPALPQDVAREIQFEVPIAPGVHERFNVELVAVTALHQFPAGTTDLMAAFFAANPTAHFAYRYDPIALINDCDGDGVYSLGPGNPPCWGAPAASLRWDVVPTTLPADIRSSTPHNCNPRPTFLATVSAPPLMNGGVIGIRIRGHNAGLFMGASTLTWAPSPWGHAWVQFKKVRSDCDPQGLGPCRWALGKYPNPVGYHNPGEIRDDRNTMANFTLWYPVTTQQWNLGRAVAVAQVAPNRCRDFNGCTDNCVVYLREVFSAAGLWLPDARGRWGCPCPKALRTKFYNMLTNGELPPDCGYIVSGNQLLDPTGQFNTYDMDLAFDLLSSEPMLLASRLEVPFVANDLKSTQLGTGGTLLLNLDFSDKVGVVVDFGDGGEAILGEPGINAHTYSQPGSYDARVCVFASDEVRTYDFRVAVGQSGNAKASRFLSIPDGAPHAPTPNPPIVPLPPYSQTFPGDVNCDWVVDGTDLGTVLAEWGTSGSTPADIDGDGIVSGTDLAIVLASWGASVN